MKASRIRNRVAGQINAAYAMPEGWVSLGAVSALALTTDRELRKMWRQAGNRAHDPRTGWTQTLALGPPDNAKAWNIACYLGERRQQS